MSSKIEISYKTYNIFCQSMFTRIFPEALKITEIQPLHKKNKINRQTQISGPQYGFKSNHSTKLATLNFHTEILKKQPFTIFNDLLLKAEKMTTSLSNKCIARPFITNTSLDVHISRKFHTQSSNSISTNIFVIYGRSLGMRLHRMSFILSSQSLEMEGEIYWIPKKIYRSERREFIFSLSPQKYSSIHSSFILTYIALYFVYYHCIS